ncbi:MAG TPA: guanylate kinase [Saprospiraceae bacterium]|nr:guanylate kinase [Saprospiraceae bacterium]
MEHKMIAVTAPSGAGKTTIVKNLMQVFPNMAFSVSATTRPKRPHEVDGKDYFFLSNRAFKEKVANGDFVEWEEVYPGIFYGTLKSEILRVQSMGKVVIFDIDVKGAVNLKREFRERCLTIFIKPPSIDTLRERLENRHTEDAKTIQKRIDKAAFELSYENKFDVTLINDELESALLNSKKIVKTFFNLKLPL